MMESVHRATHEIELYENAFDRAELADDEIGMQRAYDRFIYEILWCCETYHLLLRLGKHKEALLLLSALHQIAETSQLAHECSLAERLERLTADRQLH